VAVDLVDLVAAGRADRAVVASLADDLL